MRAELAAAVGGVIAGMNPKPTTLTDEEIETLIDAADLVTLARTGCGVIDYRGNVIDAHAPEMPTRFAKQLTQIVRGGVSIGMDRTDALRLAIRCARDSMPPMRLQIIDDLAEYPGATATEVRTRLDKPYRTVERQMQALHMLGVLTVSEVFDAALGKARWYHRLAAGIEPKALRIDVPEKLVDTSRHQLKGGGQQQDEMKRERSRAPTNFSGTSPTPQVSEFFATTNGRRSCSGCRNQLPNRESITRGTCYQCHIATK